MISLQQAIDIVAKTVFPFEAEFVDLSEALSRVLARDVFADRDFPVADLSAMDGFACRQGDWDRPLNEIETIPAGHEPCKIIGSGECARIMTGAIVPQGADTVVKVEDTKINNGQVVVVNRTENRNIRTRAQDLREGQTVLKAGRLLTPVDVAVLASVGCDPVPVVKRPVVGVIATGSELVEPCCKPKRAQIRNSNSFQLAAQVVRAGAAVKNFGTVADNPESIEAVIRKVAETCNVVLLSGGVSAGDFDFVPGVLEQCQVTLLFKKIDIKPGKPTVFGVKGKTFFFGMPGNPVSSFVLFEVLVRPFLAQLMGQVHEPVVVRARLLSGITRKADRFEIRPVRLLPDGTVRPCDYHGSAHLHGYADANGMLRLEPDVVELTKGTEVSVQLL